MATSLPALSEQLSAAATQRARLTRLRVGMPRLYRHLRRVRDERDVLSRWGQSVNLDELAGQEIVASEITSLLGKVTDVPMNPPGVHAGIQHTYGYLLSRIETPYGFKRDRWIRSTIEDGFGLPSQSLQALPRRGTLLGNLTVFLSQLSLCDQPAVATVGSVAAFKSSELFQVQGTRLLETFRLPKSVSSRARPVSETYQLQTDIFPFRRRLNDTIDSRLLVYSLRKGTEPAKLITTFPISDKTNDELLDPGRLGRRQPIRLRFNAWVDGFPATGVLGERTVNDLC
ncbi:hypothetical protein [Novipirellula caenicola]|uniref:hypothetical protein n=1 Tax=Novipirellula caenicola TaxID=1536901 RepID=UPI0031ED1569